MEEQPQQETYRAEVLQVEDNMVTVRLEDGPNAGRQIVIEDLAASNRDQVETGDDVLVTTLIAYDVNGNPTGTDYVISDFVRSDALVFLFLIFAVLTVAVGGWRGLSSLVGMALSFAVIFLFILPQIIAGWNPVLVAVLGSAVIIPITFYLSHGINKKTSIAVAGTLITLVITGILASVFVNAARLTGFAAEEASFLTFGNEGAFNMKGILLAGIIIGVLGVLDDITVSQASIVTELKEANAKLTQKELFLRAMRVGKDHIASLVNTLVLVYTGASLPLLLLFIENPLPFDQVINYEVIADEIVRTLVGSIGLIMAVPITTFLASTILTRKK